jgi:MFS family permease
MIILTVGEMLVAPVMQALVARMAPEDMRGRYMAVFGFAWVVPSALAPLMAGVVMDRYDPRWVWYAAFVIGLASAAMFLRLHRREASQIQTPAPAAPGAA